jgi:hypothetical protein
MRFFASRRLLTALLLGSAACSSKESNNSPSACEHALFCDDFEASATGANPSGAWAARLGAGTLSVDESQHHSGNKSVKLSTEGGSGTKRALLRLLSNGVFPLPNNTLFGRLMFRLESAPETSVHWTLIQAGGLVEGQTYHALYRYGGQHPITANGAFVGSQWMANYETPDSYSGTGPGSDCWHHANQTVIPVGQWSCVEWQFDGPNNAMNLWLDGETPERPQRQRHRPRLRESTRHLRVDRTRLRLTRPRLGILSTRRRAHPLD